MKKLLCLTLCVIVLCALAACGGEKPADSAQEASAAPAPAEEAVTDWTREGYFTDGDGNMLSILASTEEEYPGWYVGCFLGEDMYGWYIQQEGSTLHGNIVPDYEEGEFVVTVSDEGDDGVLLTVEGGDVYHFTPMEMPEATIFVSVNVDGCGNIEYEVGENAPEIDEEYPFQSAQINLAEPETYTLLAWPDTGWKFVKWTKDGEDFSTDAQITLEFAESADYIAVFEADEDWVTPLEVFSGEYYGGRAHADVMFMDDTAFITIEWGSSAWEFSRWSIAGTVDMETLTLEYSGCAMDIVTYNSDGELESEITEYDDGTGTIMFTEEGPGFTWHDDMSDGEDVVFEWTPPAE